MKKLHIESDIVLQSDESTTRIYSKENELVVDIKDWNAVSSLFQALEQSQRSPLSLIKLTKNLDQSISIHVEQKEVLRLKNGRIVNWKFIPSMKFIMSWFRSR